MAPARRRKQIQDGTGFLRDVWDEWANGNEWGHVGHGSDSSEAETEKAEEVAELGGDGDSSPPPPPRGRSAARAVPASAQQRAPSPITVKKAEVRQAAPVSTGRKRAPPKKAEVRPAAPVSTARRAPSPIVTPRTAEKPATQATPASAKRKPRGRVYGIPFYSPAPGEFYEGKMEEPTPPPKPQSTAKAAPAPAPVPTPAPAAAPGTLKPGFTSTVNAQGVVRYKRNGRFVSAAEALAN